MFFFKKSIPKSRKKESGSFATTALFMLEGRFGCPIINKLRVVGG